VKVATWNINGINSRIRLVLDWCEREEPDVLCLQETKCVDTRFPQKQFRAAGYDHIEFTGEKAYNGVAIVSRFPIGKIERRLPGDDPTSPKRFIAGDIKGVRIVNVYVPHGTLIGSEKFDYKLKWLGRLRRYFERKLDVEGRAILCGDLNVAPHELDVWKPAQWANKLHFTKPEREAILKLKQWGFVDLFRQMNGEVQEFSWWDYFFHSFEKDRGLRIDHIWASPPLADCCVGCWIDKEPRKLEKTSDHAPVIADFRI
jgi:exodeoxyribonuclease-3